jgi:hypothetical protein
MPQARALEKIRPVCCRLTDNHQLSTFNPLPLTVKIGVELIDKRINVFLGGANDEQQKQMGLSF